MSLGEIAIIVANRIEKIPYFIKSTSKSPNILNAYRTNNGYHYEIEQNDNYLFEQDFTTLNHISFEIFQLRYFYWLSIKHKKLLPTKGIIDITILLKQKDKLFDYIDERIHVHLLPGSNDKQAPKKFSYKKKKIIKERTYYFSGEKEKIYPYQNNVRHGVAKHFYKSGKLQAEWFYKEGNLTNGTLYYTTGEKHIDYIYENYTKKEILEYYKNGKLKNHYFFKKGKAIKSVSYNDDGTINKEYLKKQIKTIVTNNSKDSLTTKNKTLNNNFKKYYKDGILKHINFYKKNTLKTQTYFYDSGEQKKIIRYENGKRHGKSHLFYKNGTIKSEIFYKDGIKIKTILYH